MILITGSTGNIGSMLVAAFLKKQVPMRVLVRSGDKTSFPPGVEVAVGDMSVPDSLKKPMEGVQSLFLLTPVTQETTRWKGNCIRAAKEAAVEHIVNLSVANAGPQSPVNLFRWHAEAERELEASGIAWTHLRPTDLARYNTRLNLPTIQDHGAFYSTVGDGRVALVDEADVAEVAAAALLEPKHRGQIYTLTGPAALSYPEVAATIATVLGQPVRYVDISPEQAKQSMLGAGMPEWLADFINSLRQLERDGGASQVSPDIQAVVGRPATSYVESVRATLGE